MLPFNSPSTTRHFPTTSAGNTAFTEQTPVTVDTNLTLSDSDSLQMGQAQVQISGNYENGFDTLACTGTLPTGISSCTFVAGTGILTALKEGLKDKTQSSFEKAYELDRMYEEADWNSHKGELPVTGVMGYRFGRRRIMPRDANDFQ